jgi:uncharacterized protein YneF (UPF0154 family)
MSGKLNDIFEINPKSDESPTIQRRYPALRTIATIYKVIAYFCLIGGAVGVIIGIGIAAAKSRELFGSYSEGICLLIVIFSIIVGVSGFISSLAISENIKLFIDMEENTRLTNDFLRKLINKSGSSE